MGRHEDTESPPEVTGDSDVDLCLKGIRADVMTHAKVIRGLTSIARCVNLWDTTRNGIPVVATEEKRGHHPLVRILLRQAKLVSQFEQLYAQAKESGDVKLTTEVLSKLSHALTQLRDSAFKLEAETQTTLAAAESMMARMEKMAMEWRIHREKQKLAIDDLPEAELIRIASSQP